MVWLPWSAGGGTRTVLVSGDVAGAVTVLPVLAFSEMTLRIDVAKGLLSRDVQAEGRVISDRNVA